MLCDFAFGYFIRLCLCRRDSFITHRAFCDALAEERAKTGAAVLTMNAKPEVDDGKARESIKANVAVAAALETASAAAVETTSPLERQGRFCRFFFFFVVHP